MGLPADAQTASHEVATENSKLADEMSLKGLPNDSDAIEVAMGKQLNAVFLSSKLREKGSQLVSLPKEFLCSEKQAPVLAYNDFSGLEIPVIDLSDVMSGSSEKDVVEKIATACKQWGFFQVVNHGVPVAAVRKAEEQAKKLFSESFETKIQAEKSAMSGYFNSTYKMVANASSLPWTEGFQLSGPPNMDEEIDVLRRIWPETEVETFRQSMTEYHSQVQELGLRILGWIAQGLGSTMADVMGTFCSAKTDAFMRINHYPPCPEPSKVLGLAPHSDSATLTILNQGDVSGLQLLKKGGQWVSVRPIPDAFSVNIGEMAQVMSNGIYKSVLHRAVVNPVRDRYSMATFILPPKDKLITPLASAIVTQGRKAYYDFTWADFVAKRAQAKTSLVSSEKPPSGEALKKYTLWVDGKLPQEVPEQGDHEREEAALKKFTLWVDGKIPQEVPAEESEASDLKKFTLWVDGKIPQEVPAEESEASDLKKFTLWVDGKIPQEIPEESEESDLKKFTLWVDGKIPQEIPEESEESDLKKFTLWVDGKIPQEIPEESEESDLKKFTLWVDGKIPQEIPE